MHPQRDASHLGELLNASTNAASSGWVDLMWPTQSSSEQNWPTRGNSSRPGVITLYGESSAMRASNAPSSSLVTTPPLMPAAVSLAARAALDGSMERRSCGQAEVSTNGKRCGARSSSVVLPLQRM